MKHCKLLICLLVTLAASYSMAGDGRIEISQTDMTSPPYVITNSGSYVLTENLVVTNTGVYGIDVQVDSVTIDLNGFTLQGPGASSDHGIYQAESFRDLTIINGTVSKWTGALKFGLKAAGTGNRTKDITACYNDSGIRMGNGSVLEGCIAVSNSAAGDGYGIRAGLGSTLSGCSAYNNTTTGNNGHGIMAGKGSTLSNCSAHNNSFAGTYGWSFYIFGSTLSGCSAYNNSATNNGYGIWVSDSTLSGCLAHDNIAGDTGHGIMAGNGSTLLGCSVHDNTSATTNGAGIYAGYGSSVIRCTVYNNQYNGIMITRYCTVLNNTCTKNGYSGAGHGILATEDDNRIEGNNVTDSVGGYGIQTDVTGNVVIRNTASGNALGQYNLAAGMNGPIVSTMTNHPWANFEF